VGDGYAVVTSHISSKYLPGILIGYTSDIGIDANNLTKSGYVTPIVDFENIQYVFVITERKIIE
ncbi:MAG: rod shape-determining protein MreC, partial [Lachnospiraceae bacterium]|nr:rod shape-determining protein MreC [Lachnospiraceae bacterium]